jgi:hypothetical protein
MLVMGRGRLDDMEPDAMDIFDHWISLVVERDIAFVMSVRVTGKWMGALEYGDIQVALTYRSSSFIGEEISVFELRCSLEDENPRIGPGLKFDSG